MKIGIIVHSRTGHTLTVAQALLKRLLSAGHTADIARLNASGDKGRDVGTVVLEKPPATTEYDLLVFAAPVHGFALSLAMQAFLNLLPVQANKPALAFLTQSFPIPSMGGNQTARQLKDICRGKGLDMAGVEIIPWMCFIRRDRLITQAIDRLCSLIEAHHNPGIPS